VRVPLRRLVLVAGIAAIMVLGSSGSASAWQYKFQDFFDTYKSANASSVIKAKKCHGGKLGLYNFVSRVYSGAGDTELFLRVKAKLPVTEKFKLLQQVDVQVEASPNFNPDMIAQLVQGTGDFWDGVKARWKPGKLTFSHPALVLFGNQVLAAGKNTVAFKPKQGC
jgi:hypothetical protein